MFAARARYGHDLFAEELCGRCWTVQYYLSVHRAYQAPATHVESTITVVVAAESVTRATRVLSETEKYRQAFEVAAALARNLSALGIADFLHGITALSAMADLLAHGRRVSVGEASVPATRPVPATVHVGDEASRRDEHRCGDDPEGDDDVSEGDDASEG